MSTKRPSSATAATGAESYPFDPSLRIEMQTGLDRLRCVQDRSLAAVLYELYVHSERQWGDERLAREAEHEGRRAAQDERRRLVTLTQRALSGELGIEARELAERLLLDDEGKPGTALLLLQTFERALRRLQGHARNR